MTRVFPVPAPAKTSSGPCNVIAASCCAGFKSWIEELARDASTLFDPLPSRSTELGGPGLGAAVLKNGEYGTAEDTIHPWTFRYAQNAVYQEQYALTTLSIDPYVRLRIRFDKTIIGNRSGKRSSVTTFPITDQL
jgi:hypothetical protein